MQWDKAKNFMLFFFLITNLILAALINYDANSHTLTRERENAIQTVFGKNNIKMEQAIPRQFSPMRQLRLSGHDYDLDELLTIFFPTDAEITHLTTDGRDEFTWENIRLAITNGYIEFDSGLMSQGTPDKNAAIALTSEFIKKHYADFKLDINSTRTVRRGLRIFYRQEYMENLIHSNFVEFLVTGEGSDLVISQIDIQYRRPLGFAYVTKELTGPDEALLAFVQHERQHRDSPIVITHMDIAYIQESAGLRDTYTPIYAEPAYRIFVEGRDEPFIISAYTNQIS